MKHWRYLVAGLALFAGTTAAHAASTLDNVKAAGKLKCGVNTALAGFGAPNDQGGWSGFDVDLCRAVAAAVLGDAAKVQYKPLDADQRFTALQAGEIDMLADNATWTLSRETRLGLDFVAVDFFDGQAFMVKRNLGISSAKLLKGAKVCVADGTMAETNLGDFDKAHNLIFQPVKFKAADQARSAYDEGQCDAYTEDSADLATGRASSKNPSDDIILPEIISMDPRCPVVRAGDNRWSDIVRWSFFAMVIGEEKGITSANVDQVKAKNAEGAPDADAETQRFLGINDKMGEGMGLGNDWAYNILKQVGNYGESFERNLGKDTPLGLARGLNALWTQGGLQYAPPVR